MISGSLESASLKVRVKPDSLEVLDELPDADRRELHRIMNQEVLETAEFPEIFYDGTMAAEKLKEDLPSERAWEAGSSWDYQRSGFRGSSVSRS